MRRASVSVPRGPRALRRPTQTHGPARAPRVGSRAAPSSLTFAPRSLRPIPRSFGAAQWPSRKDEDRVHVSGPVPGLCDAVVQLYDGHGGKHAARYCVANLVPYVEEAFFAHPRAKPHAPNGDRDALALDVDKDTGFHPALDDALVAAFERLDAEIKRDDPSGTTAAVILLKLGKKQVDGTLSSDGGGGGSNVRDVHVKCAWVGDSRAVLCRDFDAQRVMDLSVDHKPESESEKVRIAKHYEKLGASFKSREEVLSSPEASVRAGSVHRGARTPRGVNRAIHRGS